MDQIPSANPETVKCLIWIAIQTSMCSRRILRLIQNANPENANRYTSWAETRYAQQRDEWELYGIYIQKSRNTKIISNNVSLNSGTGIHLDHSSHNEIYLNDFINNSPNVVSFRSSNNWNSSSKITYTYNDNAYTN